MGDRGAVTVGRLGTGEGLQQDDLIIPNSNVSFHVTNACASQKFVKFFTFKTFSQP